MKVLIRAEGGLGRGGMEEGNKPSLCSAWAGGGRTAAASRLCVSTELGARPQSHRVEAQIHQDEAPDGEGEKGAQARCGSFLLDGEKGRQLRQGQVSSWGGPRPSTEASRPGSSLGLSSPSLPSWCHGL